MEKKKLRKRIMKGKEEEREKQRKRLEDNNSFDGGLKWPGFEALVIRQARSSLEMKALD